MSDPTRPTGPEEPTEATAGADVPAEPAPVVAPEPAAAAAPAAPEPEAVQPEPAAAPYATEPQAAPVAEPAYAAAPPAYGAPQGTYPVGPYDATAPVAPAPAQSKGLAITALILSAVGFLISLIGFVPILGIFAVIFGGLLLLAGFIIGLIALFSRKQGGKGLSITAVVLAVVGGIVGIVAVIVSTTLFVNAVNRDSAISEPAPSISAIEPSDGATDGTGTGTQDTQAFLDEVRPQVLEVFQTIEPSITEERVAQVFPDQTLITLGETFVAIPADQREAARASFIASAGDSGLTADALGKLFDALVNAGDKYLAG